MGFIEFISQPWHWAVSGTVIAVVMVLLLFFGKSFGMSATMRTMCTLGGAGKKVKFFDFDWTTQKWNLVFMVGAIVGGYIASTLLASPEPVQLSASTASSLSDLGVVLPEESSQGYLPSDLFSFDQLFTLKGFVMLIIGGFMIGFGARYAGGCTSGHAISGLSNMQLPSLIAVIGFFIGGLVMTHFLLPFILTL